MKIIKKMVEFGVTPLFKDTLSGGVIPNSIAMFHLNSYKTNLISPSFLQITNYLTHL